MIDWPESPTRDDLIALGAYRRFTAVEAATIADDVVAAFPDLAERITIFGCDWLGRVFAADSGRGGEVLMLEPGTAEALQIPCDAGAFDDHELLHLAEPALALSFYRAWREAGGAAPGPGQCIGYRKPLFLGGVDDLENLELSDMEVYWSILSQVISQLRSRSA